MIGRIRDLAVLRYGLPAALLLVALSGVAAQERFPRPEFESGYQLPGSQDPRPRSLPAQWADAAVLILFLAAAAVAVYRLRRRWVIFLLSILALGYFGFYRRGCICPVGAIQNLSLSLTSADYVIPGFVVVFLLLPAASSLFFGRIFCSSVCPLGALQDLVMVKPLRIPRWVAVPLGFLPVVMLAFTILAATSGSIFLTCRLDPFVRVFRLEAGPAAAVYAASFLALATVIARPYCRFLCPYGVLLSWGARLSPRKVTATPDRCVGCGMCKATCPVDAVREPALLPAGADPPPRRRMPRARRADGSNRSRRGLLLLTATPVLCLACGWAISHMAGPISLLDSRARLLQRLRAEDAGAAQGTTVESEGFRLGERTLGDLEAVVADLQAALRRGGWFAGGFIGLVFCARAFFLLSRRRNDGYEPDPGECIGCGRCYDVCPRERVRRKQA